MYFMEVFEGFAPSKITYPLDSRISRKMKQLFWQNDSIKIFLQNNDNKWAKVLQDTLYSVSVIGSGRQKNVNYQVRNQKSWGGGKKLVAFMRVEQIAKGEEGKNRGGLCSLFRHIPEPLAERLLWQPTMWHLPQNLSHNFEFISDGELIYTSKKI